MVTLTGHVHDHLTAMAENTNINVGGGDWRFDLSRKKKKNNSLSHLTSPEGQRIEGEELG